MPFRLDRALEILERTPRAIEAVLSGLSPEWLAANEGPETFSPVDVLGHLGQITRVMAKHYREDVGPWREYLPVLDRR